ncbi:MAG TPA: MGMT family protein [Planctomycetota bacterium]|nr:MGMT family protein [Planctomycetota bacterium]
MQTEAFTIITPHPVDPERKLAWFGEFSERGLKRLTCEHPKAGEATSRLDARGRTLRDKLFARMTGKPVDMRWDEFDLTGAPKFHEKIWRAMMEIPFGEVRTYGEVAGMADSPVAFRACGQACGANRILLFIPCHRVVASNGIGGFGRPIEWKKMLLASEGVDAAKLSRRAMAT